MPARITLVHEAPIFVGVLAETLRAEGHEVVTFDDPAHVVEPSLATDTLEIAITRRRHPPREIRNCHFATSPIGVTGPGGAPYGNSGMASVAQPWRRCPYDHQPGHAKFVDQVSGADTCEEEVSLVRTPDATRNCRMKDAGDLLVSEGTRETGEEDFLFH